MWTAVSIWGKFSCYPRLSPIRKGFNLCVSIHHDHDVAHLRMARDAGFTYAGVDALTGIGNATEVEAAVSVACDAVGLGMIGQQGPDGKIWSRSWGNVTINEPNSQRFFTGEPELLVHYYRNLREHSANKPIIGGNLTWLSSTNPEKWVKDLWRLGASETWDYIGLHCYEGAGQETIKRYDEAAKAYRTAGFRQPFWCSEFGFRNDRWPESDEKQARWTTFVLSKLSRKLDCMGANVYSLYGNPGFALIRPDGSPTPTLGRIKEALA